VKVHDVMTKIQGLTEVEGDVRFDPSEDSDILKMIDADSNLDDDAEVGEEDVMAD